MADTRLFKVRRDDGTITTAIEIKSWIGTSSLDGSGRIPGLSRYQLQSGGALNRQADGTFRDVQTGETLTVVE